MATLPNSRHPSSRLEGTSDWRASAFPSATGKKPAASASSALLGLQAQPLSQPPEPVAPEPGVMAVLAARLVRSWNAMCSLARRWLSADFRRTQVPILILALGVWAVSARWAWDNQESATPLLLERIAQIREAQAQAAMGSVTIAPINVVRVVPAAPSAVAATPAPVLPRARQHRGELAHMLVSFHSWLLPKPTAPERVEGNPRRRVWVDMKTGLYYCPGADYYGYGGESRGKVMSQKEAQYDYFQPATGAPCE